MVAEARRHTAVRPPPFAITTGELLGKLSTPTDVARRVEWSGVDATIGNLTASELSLVNHRAMFLCVWRAGPTDFGPQLLVCDGFNFWFMFLDLNACFKNSILKLGVSNFGEPNFVGFLMKCSIW